LSIASSIVPKSLIPEIPAQNPNPQSNAWQITLTPEAILAIAAPILTASLLGIGRWLWKREMDRQAEDRLIAQKKLATVEEKVVDVEGQLFNVQRLQQVRDSDTDKKLLEIKGFLKDNYVPREDYLRHETVMEAKLDAIHRRMDELFHAMTMTYRRDTNEHRN
jgi:hypothetical protein